MLLCACAYGVKSEISLDTADSASNAIVKRSVFTNQRCTECVCLYTMDFVSAGKNTLLLYVTVCDKVVPRLNKHDDVIEWNFMKIAPPKWRAGCAPVWTSTKMWKHSTLQFGIQTTLTFFKHDDRDASSSSEKSCLYKTMEDNWTKHNVLKHF